MVLDYADGRVPDAIALLKKLRDRSGPPAVVVLTARSTEGQWLTDMAAELILAAAFTSLTWRRLERARPGRRR